MLLSACVSAPSNHSTDNKHYEYKQEIEKYSSKRVELKNKLLIEKQQKEIDELTSEIAELDKKISGFEEKIKELEQQKAITSGQVTNQNINIGPRGGCYVYTSSGKKRYVSCK